MNGNLLFLLPVLMPVLFGLAAWRARSVRGRHALCTIGLCANLLVTWGLIVLCPGQELTLWRITPTLPICFHMDGIARLFLGLVSLVWLLVGVYSYEYMTHEENEEKFDLFFMISLGVLMGLGMSANLVTLYMFYELMTLLTLPLVIHTRTREAVAAGIKYLVYSVFGASMALLGIFFMNRYGTTLSFTAGGVLDAAKIAGHESLLLAILFLMIVGFGVKAGMFPLHAWLPTAHPVAPAPASAVLSGVITKAGVLGIVRVIYYIGGVEFLRGTWVQYAFMTLSLITVVMGSTLALLEHQLKKRLAYSTVSQVSYVLFGLSTMTEAGFVGALLHVVFHSLIKNCLFLSAGSIIEQTGETDVRRMYALGKRMPVVMWCYTIASAALIGIPPACGFVSKWYLASGALSLEGSVSWIGPAALLVSALLTAAYLLPLSLRGFFPGKAQEGQVVSPCEPGPLMRWPLIVLAALCLLLGMFPTPLIEFARAIAAAVL